MYIILSECISHPFVPCVYNNYTCSILLCIPSISSLYICVNMYIHVHVLVAYFPVYTCMPTLNERCEGRKKEASKVKQTTRQKHSTPKAVTFHMYMYILAVFPVIPIYSV